jgi:DNA-directed RNA polymerase specialized sigma24 family protein
MPDESSVSGWLNGIRAGDEADIQRLWDRYFQQLVRLAGKKLPGHARREFDEEDVALSAFHSFCDRVARGQFPQLADRDGLWRLLVTITARKAVSSVRRQNRKKRGGGKVQGESAFFEAGGDEAASDGLAGFLSREPTPELAAQFAEEYDRLIDKLQSPSLKAIALRTLEGQNAEEIASELGTSPRTVHRKLQLIRALWDEEISG